MMRRRVVVVTIGALFLSGIGIVGLFLVLLWISALAWHEPHAPVMFMGFLTLACAAGAVLVGCGLWEAWRENSEKGP